MWTIAADVGARGVDRQVQAALAGGLSPSPDHLAVQRELDHVTLTQLGVRQRPRSDVHELVLARAHVARGADDEAEPVHLAGRGEDFSPQ